jgi:hypothetical protein
MPLEKELRQKSSLALCDVTRRYRKDISVFPFRYDYGVKKQKCTLNYFNFTFLLFILPTFAAFLIIIYPFYLPFS